MEVRILRVGVRGHREELPEGGLIDRCHGAEDLGCSGRRRILRKKVGLNEGIESLAGFARKLSGGRLHHTLVRLACERLGQQGLSGRRR